MGGRIHSEIEKFPRIDNWLLTTSLDDSSRLVIFSRAADMSAPSCSDIRSDSSSDSAGGSVLVFK